MTPALDLAVLGTAWVTDETENSLDVEWENPPTEVDYYKLRYGPLTGQEVAEVTVPKSSDPKSRYDITGKSQHWGCETFAGGAEARTGRAEGPGVCATPVRVKGPAALGITGTLTLATPRREPTLEAQCPLEDSLSQGGYDGTRTFLLEDLCVCAHEHTRVVCVCMCVREGE